MRILSLLSAALLLLLAACGPDDPAAVAEEAGASAGGGREADDPLARLEKGKPISKGGLTVLFPFMGKQSVMAIGDAVERQVAFVDFTEDSREGDHEGLFGKVTIDEDGKGTGSFSVAAADLRTGAETRDTKLQGDAWLDAEKHPELILKLDSLTRVRPTVWKAEGTWTMRGVGKPVSFHLNVRDVGEMRNVGDHVARATGSFEIDLKAHEIVNEAVGSPAVAETWTIDVALLGIIQASEK